MFSLDQLSPSFPSLLQKVENLTLDKRYGYSFPEMDRPLQETLLIGGKRLRPLLTFAVASLIDLDLDLIASYARAIELVHAASLSHDDVIDEATERRGRPSINAVCGNKRAVLVGDYLLADVIVELSQKNPRILAELALVIQKLAQGEWLQMDVAEAPVKRWEDILEVALHKTASVMEFCFVAPAILAGLEDRSVELFRSAGRSLGVAFQLIDDTLDFDFTHSSGKNKLQDEKNGLINSVGFYRLKGHPLEEALNFVRAYACDEIKKIEALLERLEQSMHFSVHAKQDLLVLINMVVERHH